jgi:pyruvate/2-oxoglutarate dehydrogenase complex dihydrolipoamide acyltransferase (E2) component
MARPRSTLTKFILSLPRTLSVKEVIAKAKAKGMKASENNVYRIRRTFGAKAAASPAPAKPGDAKAKPAASPPSKPNPPSKSDFIREQPATLSAAEVVAKAKAAGIKLDSFLVYKVRSRTSAKGKTKVAAKQIATPAKAAPAKKRLKSKPASVPVSKASNGSTSPASVRRSSSAEDLLRAVAAEMGLGKAIEILAGERARVQSILKG